jgi:hypothetical protein
MAALESLHTPQKVYRPLADALDVARDAEEAHYDRFSGQDGSGIKSQAARHFGPGETVRHAPVVRPPGRVRTDAGHRLVVPGPPSRSRCAERPRRRPARES